MSHVTLRLLFAAPLPLCVTAAFLVLALGLAVHAHLLPHPLFAVALTTGSLGGALLAFGDALSRHAECRRVRRILSRRGFDPRVLDAMAASRCQRDAALCAAAETGFRDAAARHYRQRGYRWHHLLPDGWRDAPWRLLAPRFLKNSFLAFLRARNGRP